MTVMGLDTLLRFELQAHLIGDFLVLTSIFMWGVFTVFGKKMTDRLGALALTGVTTIMAQQSPTNPSPNVRSCRALSTSYSPQRIRTTTIQR